MDGARLVESIVQFSRDNATKEYDTKLQQLSVIAAWLLLLEKKNVV